MSGRMDHVDADLAYVEIVAVETAFGRDVERGTRSPRKGPCAGDEVRVNVCFRYGANTESICRGGIHILVDAAVGIDDECVARCGAPHEEAGLRQARLEKMSEDH